MSLLVGLASCFMGYRLFMNGIWGNAGDLNAKFGDNKLVLKKAAPGTFFAVLGTIIICFTLWKGLDVHQRQPTGSLSATQSTEITSSADEDLTGDNTKEKEDVLDQLPDDLPE